MNKKFLIPYFTIFFTLLVLMSFSRPVTDKIRGNVIALLAPIWESLVGFKQSLTYSTENNLNIDERLSLSPQEQIQQLQLENQLMGQELSYLTSLLENVDLLSGQLALLPAEASQLNLNDEHVQKTVQRIKEHITQRIQAIPARVIFRSFDTWYYSLWINVGEADNQLYSHPIVAKNSPVLVGDTLIGVIDQVGKHQSRVRLITDFGLTPSVRAARGGEQEMLLIERINLLLNSLKRKKQVALSTAEYETLNQLLLKLRVTLQPLKKTWYLAKGELQGTNTPLGRGPSQLLKGTGFNYDFSDEEGEGRDLRTGKLLQNSNSSAISLLKIQDVLITTGMDGVFPAGLKVATISKINLLKEGDYFYELEAVPLMGNLDKISLVFVIAPLCCDPVIQ